MRKVFIFLYGAIAYVVFFGAFLYLVGFLGGFLVPKTINPPGPDDFWTGLLINVGLVSLFGIQHSLMARPSFKKWWTRFVPREIERSTYVMMTNVVLILLFWLWRPLNGVIWDVRNPVGQGVLYAVFAAGWLTVLTTTFLINHFDLFGLRQVWLYFRGQPYKPLGFVTPGPYKHVRHPLYVGWLMTFWATPTMTVAHLVFALGMTVYILIAIQMEERNLVEFHGDEYAAYRRRVPMLLPSLRPKHESAPAAPATESAGP